MLRFLFGNILIQAFIGHSDAACNSGSNFNNNLTHYWNFNGNTDDSIGGSHLYGFVNASLTTDRFGNENSALNLVYGCAQVPEGVYFAGEFTVMAWVKVREVIEWGRILDFGSQQGPNNVLLAYSQSTSLRPDLSMFNVDTSVRSEITFNNQITLDEWTHLSVTKSSLEFRAFVNGTFVNSEVSSYLPENVIRSRNFIGKSNWDWDQLANAVIDDIKIFNVALNDLEVYYHFNLN